MTRQHLDAIRLRQLRLLSLIDACGSIGEAARQLHMTQPAASQMLQELEAALGAPLAVRDARGARLTDAARAALRRFDIGLREIAEGAAALVDLGSPEVLRIGVVPIASVAWLPQAIAAMRADGLAFRMRLHEDSAAGLRDALLAGTLDCIIGRLDDAQLAGAAGIAHRTLAHDTLSIVCRRGHPALRARTLAELAGHDWILPPARFHTLSALARRFARDGLAPPRPTIESPSIHVSLRVAARSDLLTIAPGSVLDAYRDAFPIDEALRDAPDDADPVALIWRRGVDALPAFRALRERLLRAVGPSVADGSGDPPVPD